MSGVRPEGALAAAVRAFVHALVVAGVRDAIVAPGSRSTPLALALVAHPGLRTHVLIDERSAGFVALGLARTARRPVVVCVTSGTAAAELLPAAAEADLARVPLILCTADRPAELRDRGAPQTIDQVGIFGSHVRWSAEVPLADGAPETLAHTRWLAARAAAEAGAGPRGAGPVHLNLPYREPLIPDGPLGPETADDGASAAPAEVRVVTGRRRLADAEVAARARALRAEPRGLILAGPDDDRELPAAVAALAAATGYPVIADPLSGVRRGPHDRTHVLARGDQLVRPGPWIDAFGPRLVVRTGAMPTSKPCLELLARTRPETWIVDGDAGWREAALIPATFLHADAPTTLHALAQAAADAGAPVGSAWADAWRAADGAVDAALRAWLAARTTDFEGLPFALAETALPEGTLLWAGSSMPVRDLDGWLAPGPGALRVLASRGANGIDGVTSAAAGAALAHDGPVLLVTGDVSFVHDLGALVSARLLGVALTILVIDNDGGGIFSFLPQASASRPDVGLPAAFERLFGTPHGTPIASVAEALGAAVRTTGRATLAADLQAALADRRPGIRLLVLPSERARNVADHRDAAAVAAGVLAGIAGTRPA